MSFTIICDNCNRSFDGYMSADVVLCESCGLEGCETCMTLISCNVCGLECCPNCLHKDGICIDCEDERLLKNEE